MPIEIKELIIRTTVDPKAEGGKAGAGGGGKADKSTAQIVSECVEQVMEILRKQRER